MSITKSLNNFCKTKPNQCVYIQNAIDRYLNDLKRTDLYFNNEMAEFAINFIESLNHVDGSPFILEDWQKFIIGNLFGWYKKDKTTRRFKTSYIEVPRKNGKTAIAAAIILFGLVGDSKDDGQLFTCATTRDQATLCYKAAKQMIKQTDWVNDVVKVKQYEIFNTEKGFDGAVLKALSSDANSLDGLKPYIAVVDEYHAHKTDEVYNVVKSGMGATINPLLFTITTAGFNKNSPCYEERKYCIEVLNKKLKDDSLFTMIFTIDATDDWKNPKTWAKANPNLNVSVNLDFLKDELTQSLQSGTKEVNFKTKYLNIWTDVADTWISDENWVKCGSGFNESDLLGRKCWGGMDLSKSQDFSALCLIFEPLQGETQFKFLYYFWIPEDVAKERHQRNFHNYLNWKKLGLIKFTNGNVIDHQLIRNDINELKDKFDIQFINYDAVFSSTLVTELTQDEIELHPMRQGFLSLGGPTAELERMVLNNEVNHGNNEVMRWMVGNILILRDAAGLMKIDKSKAYNKVDGPVTMVMAIGAYQQAMAETPKEPEFFFYKIR